MISSPDDSIDNHFALIIVENHRIFFDLSPTFCVHYLFSFYTLFCFLFLFHYFVYIYRCPQLSVSHVSLGNILVSHSPSA